MCTDSLKNQFCSSLAALKSALILRLFSLQSQLLNLLGEPDAYSLLLQILWCKEYLLIYIISLFV